MARTPQPAAPPLPARSFSSARREIDDAAASLALHLKAHESAGARGVAAPDDTAVLREGARSGPRRDVRSRAIFPTLAGLVDCTTRYYTSATGPLTFSAPCEDNASALLHGRQVVGRER